ncbi:hypothetical protein SESBI_44268 [Sesbania bispinosa]|nr:hypothetical protein SESBI_44268 [Sesbania bispinosa]
MSLKRQRDDSELLTIDIGQVIPLRLLKKAKPLLAPPAHEHLSAPQRILSSSSMAEEAGLIKPPTQP